MVEEIKLGRIGHYHIPGEVGSDGICQTALITKVWSSTVVNVGTWEHGGQPTDGHTSVPVVGLGEEYNRIGATFHLNRACQFER